MVFGATPKHAAMESQDRALDLPLLLVKWHGLPGHPVTSMEFSATYSLCEFRVPATPVQHYGTIKLLKSESTAGAESSIN